MTLPFALARRFVAAETIDGALPVLDVLHKKGLATTLDLLGEYVAERDVAARAREEYIGLVESLAAAHPHDGAQARNISVKLSKMGQKIDERFCLDNLRQLLSVAERNDVFVRLDMEGSDTTDSTLRLFDEVHHDFRNHVGIVLQAYLKRTRQDVERMCEMGARVRLCKGAYKEPPTIAHQSMAVIRDRFTEYMQILLAHGHYPGIATHDDRLIAATKQYAAEHQIGRDRFEFQMLFGIRPETQVAIAGEGYTMRVYVPYGSDWLPYFTRRLRERKENVWFVLRNLLRR